MKLSQKKHLAKEIYKYNLIYETSTSQDEKSYAEKKISSLIKSVLALPKGFTLMLEIDAMVQDLAK